MKLNQKIQNILLTSVVELVDSFRDGIGQNRLVARRLHGRWFSNGNVAALNVRKGLSNNALYCVVAAAGLAKRSSLAQASGFDGYLGGDAVVLVVAVGDPVAGDAYDNLMPNHSAGTKCDADEPLSYGQRRGSKG